MVQRSPMRTGDQFLVREINLSVIMNRLSEHAPISRAALAEMTGLNKSTVSSLVNELIRHQFVREVGFTSNGTGRPSIQLELNPQAGYIVSVEIGVDFISAICANFAAHILWRRRDTDYEHRSQAAVAERTLALVKEGLRAGEEQVPGRGRLLGIAVGVPGLVDPRDGALLFAPNLGWENVPLRDMLLTRFPNFRIVVHNEANLAALGEYYFGAAKGYDNMLYLSAGVGLGGALIRDGSIVMGASGFASEFGHMTMDPQGERCNCGNRGCWETQVSQSALLRSAWKSMHSALNPRPNGALSRRCERRFERLSVPMVVEAADEGDPAALAALDEVGHHLGVGVASLVNALNPDLVLLGGAISLGGRYLLPVIEAELARRALRWTADATPVRLAEHGFDACVMGGVAIIFQTMLAQPTRENKYLVPGI